MLRGAPQGRSILAGAGSTKQAARGSNTWAACRESGQPLTTVRLVDEPECPAGETTEVLDSTMTVTEGREGPTRAGYRNTGPKGSVLNGFGRGHALGSSIRTEPFESSTGPIQVRGDRASSLPAGISAQALAQNEPAMSATPIKPSRGGDPRHSQETAAERLFARCAHHRTCRSGLLRDREPRASFVTSLSSSRAMTCPSKVMSASGSRRTNIRSSFGRKSGAGSRGRHAGARKPSRLQHVPTPSVGRLATDAAGSDIPAQSSWAVSGEAAGINLADGTGATSGLVAAKIPDDFRGDGFQDETHSQVLPAWAGTVTRNGITDREAVALKTTAPERGDASATPQPVRLRHAGSSTTQTPAVDDGLRLAARVADSLPGWDAPYPAQHDIPPTTTMPVGEERKVCCPGSCGEPGLALSQTAGTEPVKEQKRSTANLQRSKCRRIKPGRSGLPGVFERSL
jgi:hypothetical protein